jgi:choline dehydrogenase-like flavoprotein
MIRDLSQVEAPWPEVRTPLCIIGAGTAGIFLACQLRALGVDVLVLETGDRFARSANEMAQTCAQRSIRYRGAEQGRSFGLGGTSVLWGGQMIPLTAADMQARPAVGIDAWPVGYAELTNHLAHVKQRLGLRAGDDAGESALSARRYPGLSAFDPDFALRLSEWLPFGMRNFAQAFADPLRQDSGLVVWLNAGVVRLQCDAAEMGRILAVEARSANGRMLNVRPDLVVICAGALESTRLLLAFDESTSGRLTANGAPLGRYFADHLSVTCGRFACRDWTRYNHAVAPVFSGGVMRTPRLEIAPAAQDRLALTSAFVHFTFVTHGDTGFDVIRSFLRQRQGERQRLGLSPRRLGRVVQDVGAMAYWRVVHRQLWIPRPADLLLQVDIEQVPNWNSRLSLADDLDRLGRKRLVIDWQITPEDIRVIRTVAQRTVQAWDGSRLRNLARLEMTMPLRFDDFETQYDVYHPTGSLRMGSQPANSVTDANLRVWGLENCYVSSTAVFPSAGSANPGLMHLALTARLAEHLASRIR